MAKRHGWKWGAEIGVKAGETLELLLEAGLCMIGVDDWIERIGYTGDDWQHVDYRRQAYEVAARYPGRCWLIEADSVTAADEISDGSLDFVFIDADHRTESVVADIEAWNSKLRPGGLLCGDDANKGSVIQALNAASPGWRREGRCWHGRPQ